MGFDVSILLIALTGSLSLVIEFLDRLKTKSDKRFTKRAKMEAFLILVLIILIAVVSFYKDREEKKQHEEEMRQMEIKDRNAQQKLDSALTILRSIGYRINGYNEIVKVHKPITQITRLTVSGYVYDSEGNPLANVSLNVTNMHEPIITDERGMFYFNFGSVPADFEYSISYHKPGYESKTYNYSEIPKTNISIFLNKE